jgi:hypothetical protein
LPLQRFEISFVSAMLRGDLDRTWTSVSHLPVKSAGQLLRIFCFAQQGMPFGIDDDLRI